MAFATGLLYANLLEWVLHKYVLHGVGKNKKSNWSSHWNIHHKKSRKNDFYDDDYEKAWHSAGSRSEIMGLILLALAHSPTLFMLPTFYFGLLYGGFRYYFVHKKSHLDPEWAKEKLPWQYDHHMGKNHDANWGVTTEWIDKIAGTRVKYDNRAPEDPFINLK